MVKKTLFGLLPGCIFTDLEEDLEFESDLVITKPHKILLHNYIDSSFGSMTGTDNGTRKGTQKCIAYTFDASSNDLNDFFKLRRGALENMMILPFLGAVKHRIDFFPVYCVFANPDGSDSTLVKKQFTPVHNSFGDVIQLDRFIYKHQLEDIKAILPYFRECLSCSERFRYASHLLQRTYFEEYADIALLLLTQCLETLFQKYSIKLASRVAHFLSQDEAETTLIKKEINKAYEIRSKLVHGKIPSSHSISKAFFIMRECACKALVKLIEDDERWEIFVDDAKWDDYLQKLMQDVSDPKKEVKNLKKTVQPT